MKLFPVFVFIPKTGVDAPHLGIEVFRVSIPCGIAPKRRPYDQGYAEQKYSGAAVSTMGAAVRYVSKANI